MISFKDCDRVYDNRKNERKLHTLKSDPISIEKCSVHGSQIETSAVI